MIENAPTILVVDDVADWRITLRGLLTDEGYEVKVAGSIEEATTLLEKQPFNFAVLDIRLDETDEDNIEGVELAKTIHERWPQTKVIMITGYETTATTEETMKPVPGGDRLVHDYIMKKDTNEELLPTIQKALTEAVVS